MIFSIIGQFIAGIYRLCVMLIGAIYSIIALAYGAILLF